jgi:hypothetical protein
LASDAIGRRRHLPAIRGALLIAPALALTACADLPRDPAETTERVQRTHRIVLGAIDGVQPSPRAEAVLDEIAARLDARIVRVGGHGEKLLDDLEKGKVDLVYGRFAMASPWATHVHFGSPLGRRDDVPEDERAPRFVFRNGENGWIMLVEEAAR